MNGTAANLSGYPSQGPGAIMRKSVNWKTEKPFKVQGKRLITCLRMMSQKAITRRKARPQKNLLELSLPSSSRLFFLAFICSLPL
jgi:hypothetical protein